MHPKNRHRTTLKPLITVVGLLLAFTVAAAFLPAEAGAHGPKTVRLAYDAAAQTLSVTISHPSPNPGFHYIKRVVVRKDGKDLETTEYKSQPGTPEFTYAYKVAAVGGDILEVKVTCNIWGSKTEKITVPKATK
ncbi:MAG: hypothetical protein M0P04_08670 [Syntrophales bacterium]|jgi:hypothetical protein|nr:hypothetical protein [Syntrophales bacterium]MDD4339957.1 hypothetical protein [Syntrophales bacterium]HOG06505.1 hypothetical protein [Syntrophales bacterium]HOS78093.1 hypothetical protein [Syntrophales bacterium]HPB69972.1 hypothetical protein [Syntrophales bacterium]